MNITERTQQLLDGIDFEYKAEKFLRNILLYGLGLGLGLTLIFYNYSAELAIAIGAASFIIFELVIYATLLLTLNKRVSMIEDMLPDFLALMSSNIRSGLTPDRALLLSARKEFGPLAKEIDRAAKAAISGIPFSEAFMDMTKRIRSEMFSKTVRLIVEGVRSGGNLADLLETTSLDIRRFKSIRKEVSATVLTYKLFVFAAVALGAPGLYAVSTFLIDIVSKMKEKINVNAEELSSQLPMLQGTESVSPEIVFLFSIAAITLTAFFGSLIAGVISKGKESEGIAYTPILLFLGYAVFIVGRIILENILGGTFTF